VQTQLNHDDDVFQEKEGPPVGDGTIALDITPA